MPLRLNRSRHPPLILDSMERVPRWLECDARRGYHDVRTLFLSQLAGASGLSRSHSEGQFGGQLVLGAQYLSWHPGARPDALRHPRICRVHGATTCTRQARRASFVLTTTPCKVRTDEVFGLQNNVFTHHVSNDCLSSLSNKSGPVNCPLNTMALLKSQLFALAAFVSFQTANAACAADK